MKRKSKVIKFKGNKDPIKKEATFKLVGLVNDFLSKNKLGVKS